MFQTLLISLIPFFRLTLAKFFEISVDMELFDISGKENMAHLFASIHLSLREHDPSEDASGFYGHITNTTFEKFVER